jgi:hypothetical protein
MGTVAGLAKDFMIVMVTVACLAKGVGSLFAAMVKVVKGAAVFLAEARDLPAPCPRPPCRLDTHPFSPRLAVSVS